MTFSEYLNEVFLPFMTTEYFNTEEESEPSWQNPETFFESFQEKRFVKRTFSDALLPISCFSVARNKKCSALIRTLPGNEEASEKLMIPEHLAITDMDKHLSAQGYEDYLHLLKLLIIDREKYRVNLLELLAKTCPEVRLFCTDQMTVYTMISGGLYETENALESYLYIYLSGISVLFNNNAGVFKNELKAAVAKTCAGLPSYAGMLTGEEGGKYRTSFKNQSVRKYLTKHLFDSVDFSMKKRGEELSAFLSGLVAEKKTMSPAPFVLSGTGNVSSYIKEAGIGNSFPCGPVPKRIKDQFERYAYSINNNPAAIRRKKDTVPEPTFIMTFIYRLFNYYLADYKYDLGNILITKDDAKMYEDLYRVITGMKPQDFCADIVGIGGMVKAAAEALRDLSYELKALERKPEESCKEAASLEDHAKDADEREEELMRLTEENRMLREKNKRLIHDIRDAKESLQKEREQYEEDFIRLLSENATLKEELERGKHIEKGEEVFSVAEMLKSIPQDKILVVGGHDSWQQEMMKVLPSCSYIKNNEIAPLGEAKRFKGIRYIVYNVNFNTHSAYYRCLKNKEVDCIFIFIRKNNTELTIREIYKEIEKNRERAGV